MVAAAIRTIFAQPTGTEVIQQVDKVAAMLAPKFPTVAAMLADAREELTAFASFPAAHWTKIWSTDERFKARGIVGRVGTGLASSAGVVDPGAKSRALGLEALPRSFALEGLSVAPQWWRPRPCLVAAWLVASVASRPPAGGRRVRPAR
jgi:Transposase, Mutator family